MRDNNLRVFNRKSHIHSVSLIDWRGWMKSTQINWALQRCWLSSSARQQSLSAISSVKPKKSEQIFSLQHILQHPPLPPTHPLNSQRYRSVIGLRHACASLATNLSFLLYSRPTLHSQRDIVFSCGIAFPAAVRCVRSQSSWPFLILSMAEVEARLKKLRVPVISLGVWQPFRWR